MLRVAAACVIGTCLLSAGVASADDDVQPINYPGTFVDRPLTLRGGDVRVDLRYQFLALDGASPASNRDSQIALGAAIGITDRIEVAVSHSRDASYDLYHASGFGLQVDSDGGDFGERMQSVYAALRFGLLDKDGLGAAIEAGVEIPTGSSDAFRVVAALPLRAHLGDHFNIDMAPELGIRLEDDASDADTNRDAHLDLNIPVSGVLQFGSAFWIAGNSGVFWPSFDLDEFYIPLIGEVGFTIRSGYVPVLDIELQAGAPQLFMPGQADGVNQHFWMSRANLRFFLAH